MEFAELQSAVAAQFDGAAKTFDFDSRAYSSEGIDNLMANVVGRTTWQLTGVQDPLADDENQTITLSGACSEFFGVADAALTMVFFLDDEGDAQLLTKLALGDDWSFQGTFEALDDTIFAEAAFTTDDPPLYAFVSAPFVDSTLEYGRFVDGMNFYGKIVPGGGAFDFVRDILGSLSTTTAIGPMSIEDGAPNMALTLDFQGSLEDYFPILKNDVELRLVSLFSQTLGDMTGLLVRTTVDFGPDASATVSTMLSPWLWEALFFSAEFENVLRFNPSEFAQEFVELIGKSDLAPALPGPYGSDSQLELRGIVFGLDTGTWTPSSVSLVIGTPEGDPGWDLDGFATVKDLSLIADVANPFADDDTRSIEVTVAGDLAITTAGDPIVMTAQATAKIPSEGAATYAVTAGLSPESTLTVPIDDLIRELAQKVGDFEPPAAISDLTLSDLAVSYDTGNQNFKLNGVAELAVGDTQVGITVTVELTRQEDGTYKPTFSGVLAFGDALFTLNFTGDTQSKTLVASWESGSSGQLDFGGISDELPALSGLEALLLPERADLRLDLSDGKNKLSLDCTHSSGTKIAFLLAQDDDATPSGWIAALGLKIERISAEELGPLGAVLPPETLALDQLVVMAASANAPEGMRLTLDGQDYRFNKGFLLQGNLEVGGPSFSYPFECRLGGDEDAAPPEALTVVDTPGTLSTPAGLQGLAESPEEGQNNVAIGRTIGPVTFRKARFESRHERIYVLFDASLGSGGFELELDGLNLNFPLALLQDPDAEADDIAIGLDGLSMAYSKPPLTINGGFARTEAVEPYVDDLYEGHLLIKAETFQITVLGSYGNIVVDDEKMPSLFIYGTYDGVVGGPAAFFVTGLALGGGYNSRLVLPPIEKVAEFPLVQAVTEPAKFEIDKLREAVQPSYGDYWLAVGVKFTSFKMADSFALFSVSFGNRLQFAMLGLTKLTVPTGAEEGKRVVYAELTIRAVLDPEGGVFSIEGQLTENSYVFTKELRLTGGFAFFVWFGKSPEAGDFVISLGGYHPDFIPPPPG